MTRFEQNLKTKGQPKLSNGLPLLLEKSNVRVKK